jgi:hypothetical protein
MLVRLGLGLLAVLLTATLVTGCGHESNEQSGEAERSNAPTTTTEQAPRVTRTFAPDEATECSNTNISVERSDETGHIRICSTVGLTDDLTFSVDVECSAVFGSGEVTLLDQAGGVVEDELSSGTVDLAFDEPDCARAGELHLSAIGS